MGFVGARERWRLVLALCLAGAGCTAAPCAAGTLYVTLTLSDAARAADALDIALAVDGQTAQHRIAGRTPGRASDLVQIGFAGDYPAGHSTALTIAALSGQTVLASGTASFTAEPGCSALGLALAPVGGGDLGLADAGDATARDGDGSDGDGGDGGGGVVQLLALEPTIANTGATLTLEGTFGPTATVHFGAGTPQALSVAATVLGPHRAQVIVPGAAPSGPLTVTSNGATSAPLGFRHAPFSLGLGRFQRWPEQTAGPQPAPSLVTPRLATGVVVSGKYVYAVGGQLGGDTGFQSSVERATLNADGSLGSFTHLAGTALTTPRANHCTVAVGDAIYVLGGWGANGSNKVPLQSVERATIDADGSLGSFVSIGGLTSPRSGSSCVVVGNYLYVLGGYPGSTLTSVERAAINPDNTLSPFASVPGVTLTSARERFCTAAVGGYLYAATGLQGGGVSVERATIDPDGSLETFTSLPDVTTVTGRDRGSLVPLGASLYLVGGRSTDGTKVTDIERATIGADGSISSFAVVPNLVLASTLDWPSTVVAGDRLYVIGGSATDGTVQHASLDASGALGAFATNAGVALVAPRSAASSVVSGDHLYLIGGSNGSTRLDSVEQATISADGTLSAFTTLGAHLVTARSDHLSFVLGDQLYVIGGQGAAGFLASVERATLGADGTLGSFATVAGVALSAGRAQLTGAVVGPYLYVLGGRSQTATAVGSVERATIDLTTQPASLSTFAPVSGALAVPRTYHASAVLGEAIYLFGGTSGAGADLDSVESAAIAADGSLGAFAESSAKLTAARSRLRAATIGPGLFLVGGSLGSLERTSLALDGTFAGFATVSGHDLPASRALATGVIAGNLLSLVGGSDGSGQPLGSLDQSVLQ